MEMIKDKPVLGHGYGSFESQYMDYQAKYFINNPHSKFSILADNVKNPFNIFLLITIDFGLTGLAIFLLLISVLFRKILKSKSKYKILVLSSVSSFLVLAFFSYPLQYNITWVLIAFYFSLLLPSKDIIIKKETSSYFLRSVLVVLSVFSLLYYCNQMQAELKWKKIAVKSLKGNILTQEYNQLYKTSLRKSPFFLYNYGAILNKAGDFDESTAILTECKNKLNSYNLQIILADNLYNKGENKEAIKIYSYASNMIPSKFYPLYKIFEIYKNTENKNMAYIYANKIIDKYVKIPSIKVSLMIFRAKEYLGKEI
jgi:tetratricopeptide (TPR) repeat protein